MRTTSQRLALVVAILALGLPAIAQAQRITDAETVLINMFKVYSGLASYQDEGILITTNDGPTGGTIEKMPFKTFFKRPNLFRFEWTDYGITKLGRTKLIWFNGKEAFSYWEPDVHEKEESLSMAIAGATGISLGTVHTVSDLIIPDELGESILKKLEKASIVSEEDFEGVRCYRIMATGRSEPLELWIGKNDFLLRKVRRETKDGDEVRIREEIRRKIQVDQAIQEVVFNYKPPIALTLRKETSTEEIDKLLNPGPPIWTEFKSDEGRFTVSMPEKPITQASTFEIPQGRIEQHAFIALHSELICLVAYMDVPKQWVVGNDADGFIDGLRDQFIKEVGGKLASESSVTQDRHTGREIKVHMFRGDLRLRVFLVGDRVYILSLTKLDKSSNSGEESFKKFFGSFKLNPIVKPIAVLPKKISERVLS